MPEYKNEVPITDEAEALILMHTWWGSKTVASINRHRGEPVHIERATYSGGYTREEYSGSTCYLLDEAVADSLLSKGYVAGKPEWGFTDMKTLRLTDYGETVARKFRDERAKRYTAELGDAVRALDLPATDLDSALQKLERLASNVRATEWLYTRLQRLGDQCKDAAAVRKELAELFPEQSDQ